MVPTNTILDATVNLLATDTGTLAAASAMKVHLIAQNFTPSATTDFTTLTEATFTGSAAKSAGTGAQQVFVDPITGARTLQILEPAGGWTWSCTATPGAPETVYGFVLTDNADAVTYGSARLPAPIQISASGQGLHVPYLIFVLATNPWS